MYILNEYLSLYSNLVCYFFLNLIKDNERGKKIKKPRLPLQISAEGLPHVLSHPFRVLVAVQRLWCLLRPN